MVGKIEECLEKKHGLTKKQVKKIKKKLRREKSLDELVILSVALNTLLRGSDLLQLKRYHVMTSVDEIQPTSFKEQVLFRIYGQKSLYHKAIKESFTIIQRKTNHPVTVFLSKSTKKTLYQYILHYNIDADSYLFSLKSGVPMSPSSYRKLIKRLVKKIGLNPDSYSGHSTRRTTAMLLYEKTKNIEFVRKALGHRSIQATISYLGIETQDIGDEIKKMA